MFNCPAEKCRTAVTGILFAQPSESWLKESFLKDREGYLTGFRRGVELTLKSCRFLTWNVAYADEMRATVLAEGSCTGSSAGALAFVTDRLQPVDYGILFAANDRTETESLRERVRSWLYAKLSEY